LKKSFEITEKTTHEEILERLDLELDKTLRAAQRNTRIGLVFSVAGFVLLLYVLFLLPLWLK